MNKRKYTIYGIVALVIIIMLFILPPWIDGYFFKKYYYELIAASNYKLNESNSGVSLVIDRYKLGIRHSKATLRIVFADKEAKKEIPNGIMIETDITHGPFVLNPLTNSTELAFANMNSQIYLSELIPSELLENPTKKWLVEANATIGFGGDWKQRVKVDPLNIPFLGKLMINDSISEGKIEIVNNQFSYLNAHGKIGAITLNNPDSAVSLNILPMNVSQTLVKNDKSLKSDQMITLPSVSVAYSHNSINLQNLSIQFANEITASRLYNGKLDINFDRLSADKNMFIGPLELSLVATALNQDGLEALKKLLEKEHPNDNQNAWTEQEMVEIKAILPTLFTKASAQLTNFSFKSSQGGLKVNAKITLNPDAPIAASAQPQSSLTVYDWLDQLNVRADVNITNDLLLFAVTHMVNNMPNQQPVLANNQTKENSLQKYMALLLQQGKLTLSQSLEILELSQKATSVDEFSQKAYLIVKPEDAPQLAQAYISMQQEKLAALTTQSQLSPAEKAQLIISNWQSLGYITPTTDGNYQTVITLKDKVVLMNGKTLDTNQAMQVPQPATPATPNIAKPQIVTPVSQPQVPVPQP